MLKDFVAFDFEMPTQEEPAISAIGITVVENYKITKRIYSLINPETNFSPYVIKLIGITPEMVKDKPTLPEFWEEIKSYFTSGNVLVAHAAYGDLLTLVMALNRYDISIDEEINYLCTCDMTLEESPDFERHTLDYICEHFNIELAHHNAQSDSDGCALVLLEYIKQGINVEKYIKTEKASEIVQKHRKKNLAKALKAAVFKNKKSISLQKEKTEIETFVLDELKNLPRSKNNPKIKKSIIRNNCACLEIGDDLLRRFTKNLSIDLVDEILDNGIYYTYEMYRIYVYCFNQCGYDVKSFLNFLYNLPSYYALEGLDVRAVTDVFSAQYGVDVSGIAEELSKRNVYGNLCLCAYLITSIELWKTDPETVLVCLDFMCKSKHSTDKVLMAKFSEILSWLIYIGGYDKEILSMELPKKSLSSAVSLALDKKSDRKSEIKDAYSRYLF